LFGLLHAPAIQGQSQAPAADIYGSDAFRLAWIILFVTFEKSSRRLDNDSVAALFALVVLLEQDTPGAAGLDYFGWGISSEMRYVSSLIVK
jgi:hypothetical protein